MVSVTPPPVRLTANEMREAIKIQRQEIAQLRNTLKAHIGGLKMLRQNLLREVQINRVVKEDHRRAVREAREAKKAERNAVRIQKLEAKLLALKSPKATRKANQKASAAKVYSADEIAALNAARS
jgi:hypothetical protein